MKLQTDSSLKVNISYYDVRNTLEDISVENVSKTNITVFIKNYCPT